MKKLIITAVLAFLYTTIDAQQMSLPAVMDSIAANHPVVKMYNAEIRQWMLPQKEQEAGCLQP
jgi:hypothetical protein